MDTSEIRDFEQHLSGRPDSPASLSRRTFIKLFGAGIVVCFTISDWSVLEAQGQRREYPADFNAYLRIAEDGRVTVFSGKIEMGQGVITSLAQMAAEELGVALGSVEMVMGDTQRCPWDMGTFGSMSTRFFGPALRGAAAEARAVLLELASGRLRAPVTELAVADGTVFVAREKGRRVSFGQLARGQAIQRHLDGKPKLRSVQEWTVSGRSAKRTDGRPKVTGEAKYAGDIRLPRMLYACVLRPPAHGATLKSVDTAAAAARPGVTVVNRDGLVATLHAEPDAAAAALAAVKAEYDVPAPTANSDTIFDHLVAVAPAPQERERKGDLAAGEAGSVARFEHRFENGYGAHAPMETHTALASVEGGKATVWAATQTPFPDQQRIAEALDLPVDDVRVITPFVGGGFGGKSGTPLQSIEAAKLSRIAGRPVQVAFNRAEEFFHDTFRPAAVVKIRSGLDGDGRIVLWDYEVWFAGARSTEQFYDVPNNLIRVYGQWGRDTTNAHPFATGPWRAPGANINVFARESQLDIMAAKAAIDPLEFRLKNTSDPRARSVLQEAAKRFGWQPGRGPSGRGIGIACGIDAGTYVALCAEVRVDKASGRVKVNRIVCAQDMGQVINPEGATMQMEGCITMGLGYALTEKVRFEGGRIDERNFDTYELPRFSTLPAIETFLVRNDALSPQGGGEPALVPVGAAIANAVFDATGARVFEMPMTPEVVKRAMDDR
jgi:nicotinate dehydrogenase subunit B